MIDLLSQNPILLLFVVASIGYLVGSIKVYGNSLGVAAVLFVGLFVGSMNADLHIPDEIFYLGLVLFVYSVGLESGPAFFKSYKANGFRDIGFILLMLCISAAIAVALSYAFGFSPSTITGIYAGSTTNTPALAGVLDYINTNNLEGASVKSQNLVVGYSYSYPLGVLGGIVAIALMGKWLKIDFQSEEKKLRKKYAVGGNLSSWVIKITNDQVFGKSVRDVWKDLDSSLSLGRVKKGDEVSIANWDTILNAGDELTLIGDQEDLTLARVKLGPKINSKIPYDRRKYDVNNIFLSNPYVAGKTLASLNLNEKYDAVITRIRRGDTEMVALPKTVLEIGDRVRFVARREDLKSLSKYFGDSYKESNTINIFSFGLGMGLGLLLGLVEFTLSDGVTFKLGYAGGPLIVGLLLGAVRRTGAIVWTLPYGAMVTLKQIGLIFILAVAGVKSGHSFINSIGGEALYFFMAAAIVSLLTAFLTLYIGFKWIKIPFSILTGIVSNHPAILDFGIEKAKNQLPNIGYSMMFPIALIGKILIAQFIFLLLS